ncbi:MAG: ATP phosphoribosyltransferase [Spirochaetes bacterium]|nr:ATP phosphoribosyltransferase [Spirochaetota bacterium]
MDTNQKMITIALPKGRLLSQITKYLSPTGIQIKEESRKLDFLDTNHQIRFLFVKNSDVPVYVNYGVADLGICGTDVIYESDFQFLHLFTFPFGKTRICLAGYEKNRNLLSRSGEYKNFVKEIKIATKFIRYAQEYFVERGLPIKIIKLSGSVELAPILGLTDFIVDLVETGTTLKENNLSVIEQLGETEVELIANPGLYKLHYQRIDQFIREVEKIKS